MQKISYGDKFVKILNSILRKIKTKSTTTTNNPKKAKDLLLSIKACNLPKMIIPPINRKDKIEAAIAPLLLVRSKPTNPVRNMAR